LQHGPEKVVDVPVLKVTHASEQVLHELGLLGGRPLVKHLQALVLLLGELGILLDIARAQCAHVSIEAVRLAAARCSYSRRLVKHSFFLLFLVSTFILDSML
jgi:hypothetical protein